MKRILSILLLTIALGAPTSLISAMQMPMPMAGVQVHSGPTVTASQGRLTINSPEVDVTYTFHIFSITGQLIKTVRLCGDSADIELRQGCYIVKCEKWSKKVIVN